MDTREAYVGIDVAFAKRKLLPVAVCIKTDVPLEILPLRANFDKPPAGRGNVRALEEQARRQFAEEVLVWLRKLEEDEHLNLKRIAIDAPSDYCRNRAGRRAAEASLDAEAISCFTTPSEDAFRLIIEKCRKFLADGGKPSRMPNANQLWMLVGFELFRVLKPHYECIETYPQAVVRELKCASDHKSTGQGLANQIEEASKVLKLSAEEMTKKLRTMGYGSRHDRLDAFLSAWVASLDDTKRKAFGNLPDDVIWVPKLPVPLSMSPSGSSPDDGQCSSC